MQPELEKRVILWSVVCCNRGNDRGQLTRSVMGSVLVSSVSCWINSSQLDCVTQYWSIDLRQNSQVISYSVELYLKILFCHFPEHLWVFFNEKGRPGGTFEINILYQITVSPQVLNYLQCGTVSSLNLASKRPEQEANPAPHSFQGVGGAAGD